MTYGGIVVIVVAVSGPVVEVVGAEVVVVVDGQRLHSSYVSTSSPFAADAADAGETNAVDGARGAARTSPRIRYAPSPRWMPLRLVLRSTSPALCH